MSKSKLSRREFRENPPPAERRAIEARIRLLPLMRPGALGLIDWRGLAGRLAAELAAVLTRLDGVTGATAADLERAERGRAVLQAYRDAVAADADIEVPDDAGATGVGAGGRGAKKSRRRVATEQGA